MRSLSAARPSTSARALHALDRRVQRMVQRQLGPLVRQMASDMRQALVYEPGLLIARYRALRPQWLQRGEQLLEHVAQHAIDTATRAFLRAIVRQYGTSTARVLLAAEDDEDEVNEDVLADLLGVETSRAHLLLLLLYRPDAWGSTPLERLTGQETTTSRELWARLQGIERLSQGLLIALGALPYMRGVRLRSGLRKIEQAARKALAESPAQKRLFLDLLRQAKQAAQGESGISPRMLGDLEKMALEGRDAAREAVVTEQLGARALRRAEVLARTLAAQAYALAIKALAKQAGVTQMRWSLSASHPREDICDELEGVYLIEELPDYPAHPRCLCELIVLWPEQDEGEESDL
mgnify:CR=1 FL=1